MRRWFDLNQLDEPASASLQLFPRRLSRSRFLWSQPLSYDALVARVKRAVEMLGLAKEEYSGHSLRTPCELEGPPTCSSHVHRTT